MTAVAVTPVEAVMALMSAAISLALSPADGAEVVADPAWPDIVIVSVAEVLLATT